MKISPSYPSELSVLLQLILVFFFMYLCLHDIRDHRHMADAQNATTTAIDVGVILDLDTLVGKIYQTCLSMALSDFYSTHNNYKTKLVLHTRDSNSDTMDAASSAIDLLKNVQVQAILGPQKSAQAEFVVNIGNKTRVPIISFSATSPSLSFSKTHYFIRTTLNDSAQVKAIASIVQAFGWREVVPIYEDTPYGNDIIPYLTDAIQDLNAKIPYRSVLSLLATDHQILEELYKLKTMQTRVFIVHMSFPLGSRLFLKAKEAGMMGEGYAWIITDGLTGLLGSMDSSIIESMEGVIGVKPYISRSKELENFKIRWRRTFIRENPDIDTAEVNILGLRAYDSLWALAIAVEQIDKFDGPRFVKPASIIKNSNIDLATIGVSQIGPQLLQAILSTNFRGLSGELKLMNGQLQPSAFQIVNVIGKGERGIGFWTPALGITKKLSRSSKTNTYSTSMLDLGAIIWPGDSTHVPKGWEVPTSGKKLRIGVPKKEGFSEFVKVEVDPRTKAATVTGFCIDVFKAVMDSLPYAVPYEFIPFAKDDGQSAGDYDDLVYEVYLQKYDAVVGDTTIVGNRSLYVDFALPFTESGVSMIVPNKLDERKNPWIFLKPLSRNLWITSAGLFILTGFVVWVLERRTNKDFRGSRWEQASMVFWFGFSTLVFANRERVATSLSRIVMIIWVFVVLILTSSYTASLTSRLTVQQLQPTVTDIQELIKNGDYIGYQQGSFIKGLIQRQFKKLDPSKLKEYDSPEEYNEALYIGSRRGGVAAIIEEIPYIKLFLAKYCKNYTMVGPTYKTAGFGFAFPKGSPLVPDVSTAVLNVTQGDKMEQIERTWFDHQPLCSEQRGTSVTSDSLNLESFIALFIITGVVSISALLIFLGIFLYKNKDIFYTEPPTSTRQKLMDLLERYNTPIPNEEEPPVGQIANPGEAVVQSNGVPAIIEAPQPNEGVPAIIEAPDQVELPLVQPSEGVPAIIEALHQVEIPLVQPTEGVPAIIEAPHEVEMAAVPLPNPGDVVRN